MTELLICCFAPHTFMQAARAHGEVILSGALAFELPARRDEAATWYWG